MPDLQPINDRLSPSPSTPENIGQVIPKREVGGARHKGEGKVDVDRTDKQGLPGLQPSPDFLPPGAGRLNLDPALLMSIVTEVFNNLDEKQAASFMQMLKNAEPRYSKILASRLEEVKTRFDKMKAGKEIDRKNQIASDVQLGVGVALTVIGILATILTAGALSGFMIAGMALSASMTTLDVVNRGLKAGKVQYDDPLDKSGKGKKQLDISIGGLMRMAVEEDFANGKIKLPSNIDPNDKAAVQKYRESWVTGMTVAMTIVIAVVGLGLGAGAFKAASNMGDVAKKAGNLFENVAPKIAEFARDNVATIQMVNQGMEIAGDLANLATSIYQGANTIVRADVTYQMRMAEANLNQLDSYADIARAIIARIQESMKSSADGIGEAKKIMADTRANLNSSLSNITISS